MTRRHSSSKYVKLEARSVGAPVGARSARRRIGAATRVTGPGRRVGPDGIPGAVRGRRAIAHDVLAGIAHGAHRTGNPRLHVLAGPAATGSRGLVHRPGSITRAERCRRARAALLTAHARRVRTGVGRVPASEEPQEEPEARASSHHPATLAARVLPHERAQPSDESRTRPSHGPRRSSPWAESRRWSVLTRKRAPPGAGPKVCRCGLQWR